VDIRIIENKGGEAVICYLFTTHDANSFGKCDGVDDFNCLGNIKNNDTNTS
jgi:hypothetical protein